jgi:hypothetical protein
MLAFGKIADSKEDLGKLAREKSKGISGSKLVTSPLSKGLFPFLAKCG